MIPINILFVGIFSCPIGKALSWESMEIFSYKVKTIMRRDCFSKVRVLAQRGKEKQFGWLKVYKFGNNVRDTVEGAG
jgi:hypothetical protein